MARKQKHPEHENLERWLVSYADFMTLLFATFTALYAMAQTDAARLKDISQAIREGFAEQSIISGIKSVLQGQSPPTENPDPIASTKGAGAGVIGKFDSMTYKPGEVKSMQKLASELSQDLEQLNKEFRVSTGGHKQYTGVGSGKSDKTMEDSSVAIRPVEASIQERGIRVSFDSRMLFEPGSARIRPEGLKALDVVAARLKKFDNNRIHVEGHTDSQPIATALFPSNWELSAGRASSVVRHLIGKHDFNPSSMVAVGYGSTQPLAANDTPEGRTRNRRVDIILYSQKLSQVLNPRVQYLKEQPLAVKSENPAAPKEVLPVLPEVKPDQKYTDGPVKVIIKERDGTEKILVPKVKEVKPDSESKGAEAKGVDTASSDAKAKVETHAPKPDAHAPASKSAHH